MVFKINSTYSNLNIARYKIKKSAKLIIMLYPKSTAEILLNDYLILNYHKTLQQMCLDLLNKCSINKLAKNKYTIMFKDKKLDKIASLITYGNRSLRGSRILRAAFGE